MYTGVAPHQKSLHVIIEEVLPEVISFATLDDELDMEGAFNILAVVLGTTKVRKRSSPIILTMDNFKCCG